MAGNFRSTIEDTQPTGKESIVTGKEDDKQLVSKFNQWFKQSEPLFQERLKWVQHNQDQYIGNHIHNLWRRPTHKSNTIHNKQFENVETIVPILTEDIPEPLAAVDTDDPVILKGARTVENALKYLARTDDLLIKSESIVRDMLVKRDAVATPIWDPTIGAKGDITVEIVDANFIRVDPNSTWDRPGDYFFKVIPRSYRWVVDQYPDEKEFILNSFGVTSESELSLTNNVGASGGTHGHHGNSLHGEQMKQLERMIVLKEVWYWRQEESGEHHIWRAVYLKNKILENTRNPYWDFEGELNPELEAEMLRAIEKTAENIRLQEGRDMSEEERTEIEEEFRQRRSFNNFMPREELPYVVFPTFINYNKPWSATSLVEQVTSLQRSLNKRKQQIDENANLMANGQWIADKNVGIDDHLFNNAPGAVYKKNPGSELRRESGVPMPTYIFNDLQDSEIAIDNVFGANDISKGQVTNARTATESVLLKQADRGRVALLGRHFKRSMAKLYQWQVHLMKLFYDEPRTIALFDAVGGVTSFQKISRDEIPDDMQIFVKADTARPKSQEVRRAQAIEQFQTGSLDPITMFEQTGDYSNPVEKAEMLWKWQTGQLFEQPIDSIEEQANKENEAIFAGEQVPPNQDANETHIQIHANALGDETLALTDKQIESLEEHMQLELQALQAKKTEGRAQAALGKVPADLARNFPDQVPEQNLEQVIGELENEFEGEIIGLSRAGVKQPRE